MRFGYLKFGIWLPGIMISAFLLRDIISLIQKKSSATDIPQAIASSRQLPLSQKSKNVADYQIILDRNLFNANPSLPPIPQENPLDQAVERLDLKLLGIIRDPDRPICIIQEKGSQKIHVLGIHEKLSDQTEVIAIEYRRVFLMREDKTEILSIEEEKKGDNIQIASLGQTAQTGNGDIRKVDEFHYTVDRRLIESKISDFGSLLNEVGINPIFNEDGTSAIRLSFIADQSVFRQIGLQKGDVIEGINGEPITNFQQGFEIFQRFQTDTKIALSIKRKGQTQEIHYDIR